MAKTFDKKSAAQVIISKDALTKCVIVNLLELP